MEATYIQGNTFELHEEPKVPSNTPPGRGGKLVRDILYSLKGRGAQICSGAYSAFFASKLLIMTAEVSEKGVANSGV